MTSQALCRGLLLPKLYPVDSRCSQVGTAGVFRVFRKQFSHRSPPGGQKKGLKPGKLSTLGGRQSISWVSATSEKRNDFQQRANEAAEQVKRKSAEAAKAVSDKTSELFGSAKEQAVRFERDNDLTGKAKGAFRAANEKYEELGDNIRRGTARLNSEYKVSEKAKQWAESLGNQAQAVDEKLGIKAKFGEFSADLRLNMPRYQRQLRVFLATPLGRFLTFSFFAWLVLSGWFFRIFFWSVWLVPLLPLVFQSIARQTVIQGVCPACGLAYAGSKSSVLVCRRCRGIVWQPGQSMQNFNKNDPNIIDIDID